MITQNRKPSFKIWMHSYWTLAYAFGLQKWCANEQYIAIKPLKLNSWQKDEQTSIIMKICILHVFFKMPINRIRLDFARQKLRCWNWKKKTLHTLKIVKNHAIILLNPEIMKIMKTWILENRFMVRLLAT